MSPHAPMRFCPHRWCRPLHTLLIAIALVSIVQEVLHAFVIAVASGLALFALLWAVRALRGVDPIKEVIIAARPRVSETLLVRTGWARAAAAFDLLATTDMGYDTAQALAHPGTPPHLTLVRLLLATAGSVTLFAGLIAVHAMATRPARAARVPVTAS